MEIRSAALYPLSGLAELFNAAFAGYVIPLKMSADTLAERVANEDIDLALSRVVVRGGEELGLALMARRGRESRLAAMGIRTESRSAGAGRFLLAHVLRDARQRADRRMRLEVFESNAPARALYEGSGFTVVRRLVGYDCARPAAGVAFKLDEIDPAAFSRQLGLFTLPAALPWQLEPATLAAPPRAARCFTLEQKSFVYVSGVTEAAVAIRGLLTVPSERGKGNARKLLRGLAAMFPDRAFSVPTLIPEDLAVPFFAALGFARSDLAQVEMALDLA
ncbi:MAG: GNAT family N-acetyltransferase [Myxococcales bacterium]|nr:GNAT family N-acetyltransferase [Myxococcales bacterium]